MSAAAPKAISKALSLTTRELARSLLEDRSAMVFFERNILSNFNIKRAIDIEEVVRDIAQFGRMGEVESSRIPPSNIKSFFSRRAVVYARVENELEKWIKEGSLT